MARTSDTEVRRVLDVDPNLSDLTPFIDMANELVTEVCSDSGYTDGRLLMIETWLAAHMVCSRDPRVKSEGVGSISATYQMQGGLFLEQTTYGQNALLLDTAGNLAALGKRIEAGQKQSDTGIVWLGTEDTGE